MQNSQVKLAESAVGKLLKVFVWSGASAILSVLAVWVSNAHLPAKYALFAVLIPVVNSVLVGAKNFADKQVPNLPTTWR